jgi:hypothetical protein
MESLLDKAQFLDDLRPGEVLYFGIRNLKLCAKELFDFIELDKPVANPDEMD